MELNYYPGCTLHGSARDYHESILMTTKALDVHVRELEDWNCCGASSAHVLHPGAAWRLPARNLLIAARRDVPLLVPCAACFHRLKLAQHKIRNTPEIEPEYKPALEVRVMHVNEFLGLPETLERLGARVKRPLDALKVAPYYGCLTVRPPAAMNHDRPEDPRDLDEALRRVGAHVVRWTYKTDCCGGNLAMTRPDIVKRLSGNLFFAAKEAGAEAIVTDCPMCQANLDTRQREIERELGIAFDMPTLYITEVVSLALGLSEVHGLWRKHLVDPRPLMRRLGLAA
jgi:heterodisulfide reductase subunit B